MHRVLVLFAVLAVALAVTGPAAAAGSAGIAALQVALRAQGQYPASVDGVDGPLTRAGLTTFQKRAGLTCERHDRAGHPPRPRAARAAAARPA